MGSNPTPATSLAHALHRLRPVFRAQGSILHQLYVPGAEASLLALIEPVLNPVWVALVVGEEPSAATIIGGAIIMLGLGARHTLLRPQEAGQPGFELEEIV